MIIPPTRRDVLCTGVALLSPRSYAQFLPFPATGRAPVSAGSGIVFDNSSQGQANYSNSLSFSHTVTSNTNGLLLLGFYLKSATPGVVTASYNGAAMTLLHGPIADNGSKRAFLFYLLTPDTGAHNIVINATSAGDSIGAVAMSYTGVSQTGFPDSSNTKGGAAGPSPYTITVTPSAGSAWYAGFGYDSSTNGQTAAGGCVLRRNTIGQDDYTGFDSNGPKSGSQTPGFIFSGAGSAILVVASFVAA